MKEAIGTNSYQPKISVVIPAYNASNYLSEAIDSALAQTYENIEIIVVNDGSDDCGETEKTALSYGDKIRYFSKENGGSSSALNMGIVNMTGEWFSWLSHDDLYVPEKLERQVEFISKLNIDKAELPKHIFFSDFVLIDSGGKLLRKNNTKKARKLSEKIEAFPHNGFLIAEPTVYVFHGCSCLIHKNVFENVGMFDEKLRYVNDVDLWYRLYSEGYKVHYISEPLVKGRVHPQQVSRSIGFSYHNSEQDMFWNRSLDWLIANFPYCENLFFMFGRNAYLKTRNVEGDRAFKYIKSSKIKKCLYRFIYKTNASLRSFAKRLYLIVMCKKK